MHLDPHVAIAAVSTLAAGWLMITAGLQKSALAGDLPGATRSTGGTQGLDESCAPFAQPLPVGFGGDRPPRKAMLRNDACGRLNRRVG